MSFTRPHRSRYWIYTGLIVVCLLLSGCVYYRLWQVQRQLSDFDRYFVVDTGGDGLILRFERPVLLAKDMAYLELSPEGYKKIGSNERWEFRWRKTHHAPGENSEDYEISVSLVFNNNRLVSVILPERLFSFIPKDAFVHYLRAFGGAQVDRAAREARAIVADEELNALEMRPVTVNEVEAMLGAPLSSDRSSAPWKWRYRYRGVSPDQKAGHIDTVFYFSPRTGNVVRVEGRLLAGSISLEFPE